MVGKGTDRHKIIIRNKIYTRMWKGFNSVVDVYKVFRGRQEAPGVLFLMTRGLG